MGFEIFSEENMGISNIFKKKYGGLKPFQKNIRRCETCVEKNVGT